MFSSPVTVGDTVSKTDHSLSAVMSTTTAASAGVAGNCVIYFWREFENLDHVYTGTILFTLTFTLMVSTAVFAVNTYYQVAFTQRQYETLRENNE